MEATVCNALKFNFNFRTPIQYVERFLRASYVSSESSTTANVPSNEAAMSSLRCSSDVANNATNVLLKKLVFYLLDLSTLEYKLVTKKPSLVTAAAVYLARATLGITNSRNDVSLSRACSGYWSKTLEYYTGYDVCDIEECVRLLHRLQENAEDSKFASIFNRHKSIKCKKVALKTVLNEDALGFL